MPCASIMNQSNCFLSHTLVHRPCTVQRQLKLKGKGYTHIFVLHGPTWSLLGPEYFALSAAQQALESNVHWDVNIIKRLFSVAETGQDELHLLAHMGCSFSLSHSFLFLAHSHSHHQQFVSLVRHIAPPWYLLPLWLCCF